MALSDDDFNADFDAAVADRVFSAAVVGLVGEGGFLDAAARVLAVRISSPGGILSPRPLIVDQEQLY